MPKEDNPCNIMTDRTQRKWIVKRRTDAGGWTKAQLEALGESWPPKAGWLNRAAAAHLTREQIMNFSRASTDYHRRTQEKFDEAMKGVTFTVIQLVP